MRLKCKNSICLVYKLWIAFTVITFDFVKSLRNPYISSYDFIPSTSSAKEMFYSTKTPLKSSRTTQLTDLLAQPHHLPNSQNLSSAIPLVATKREKIEQNEVFPHQNLGGFNYVTDEQSLNLIKTEVPNSRRTKSYSKRNTENKVNKRGKRHLEKIDVVQQVRATCRSHIHHIHIPAYKQNSSLMDDREGNPKTLQNHQKSIALQSLQATTQPENSHAPTLLTAFTTNFPVHLLRPNVKMSTINISDVGEDRSDFQETNGKVNNRRPLQRKERFLYCNEEQQNSKENFEKLSSVNLLHSNKTLVWPNETNEQPPLHDGEYKGDGNHTQFKSQEIGRKIGKLSSQNFHILKTRNAYSKRSFTPEEHVSEDVIIDAFETFTTTRAEEEEEIESEVTESQFSESTNNKRSGTTSRMSIVKSRTSTMQISVSQELISSPFTIIDNMTPSYESSELVSYSIINSNSTEKLEIQTTSGEHDDLIERFKLKYPVKLWKSLGLLEDTYLKNINPHWMKFEPPSPIVHKIFAAFYGVFMVVGCGANFIVIFMFSRCRSLRTPPNYLILNLAISDFFMMAKTPIYIVNSIYYGPALGQLGCSIYGFVGGLTGTASIMTLASIAVDRYYAIVHPLNPFKRTTSQRVSFMILFVWVYAAVFSSLPLFGVNNYTSEGYLTSCSFDYLSENMQHRMFVFIFFLAAWLFPLTVIMFSYANIFRIVRAAERMEIFCSNVRQPVGESFKCKPALGRKQKSEVKIAFLAGVLISLWLVAWTPYALVALFGIFGGKQFLTPLISSIPSLFCKTASCINPFVYSLNHPKFQRELRSYFTICFRHTQKDRNGSRNNSYCSAVTYRANDNLVEDADQPNLTTRRSLNLIKVAEANVELGLVKYDLKSRDIQVTNIGETHNSSSNSDSK